MPTQFVEKKQTACSDVHYPSPTSDSLDDLIFRLHDFLRTGAEIFEELEHFLFTPTTQIWLKIRTKAQNDLHGVKGESIPTTIVPIPPFCLEYPQKKKN